MISQISMVYGASVIFEGYVDFVEFEEFRYFVYFRIFKDLRARFFAEKKLMFLWRHTCAHLMLVASVLICSDFRMKCL